MSMGIYLTSVLAVKLNVSSWPYICVANVTVKGLNILSYFLGHHDINHGGQT